jgi:hypothetical protein
MGLLARTLVFAFGAAGAACYEPELRDCTLACSSTSDCADGQVCGSDRFCASPELAGNCFSAGRRDAGASSTTSDDAGVPIVDDASMPTFDAAAPMPDATTTAILTIQIDGRGEVYVQSHGTCDDQAPDNRCEYVVPLDSFIVLAADGDRDWRFDEWSAGPCKNSESSACVFQLTSDTTANAKFRRED